MKTKTFSCIEKTPISFNELQDIVNNRSNNYTTRTVIKYDIPECSKKNDRYCVSLYTSKNGFNLYRWSDPNRYPPIIRPSIKFGYVRIGWIKFKEL
ncbi:MAG: hypothetical protein WCS34_09380 [Bacteroidales bacterium]